MRQGFRAALGLAPVFLGALARRRVASVLSLVAIMLGVALGMGVQLIHNAALAEFDRGMRSLEGQADRVGAHVPAGGEGHLAVLDVQARGGEDADGAGVVVVQVGDDHVADGLAREATPQPAPQPLGEGPHLARTVRTSGITSLSAVGKGPSLRWRSAGCITARFSLVLILSPANRRSRQPVMPSAISRRSVREASVRGCASGSTQKRPAGEAAAQHRRPVAHGCHCFLVVFATR